MAQLAARKYAQALRRDLSDRNRQFATAHHLPHWLSPGEVPTVWYEPYEERGTARHGNFLPLTYQAILADPQWRARLLKPYRPERRALPPNGRRWMELDSANSSAALLMNVFCYPRVLAGGYLGRLLGLDCDDPHPEFGFKARVALAPGRTDPSEVGMRLGNLLVEAMLTESDFQLKAKAVVEGYRDFDEVFDRCALPQTPTQYLSSQLLRNLLAAHQTGATFCVLCDERRLDLMRSWYEVMRGVRIAALRVRCKALTWQELAWLLPPPLRAFLAEKYGIG